jgi:hypothetical protein
MIMTERTGWAPLKIYYPDFVGCPPHFQGYSLIWKVVLFYWLAWPKHRVIGKLSKVYFAIGNL